MRITRHPNTNWKQVWKNLHTAWVAEETTSIWYTVLHDIVPTNERLYAIRLVKSDRCRHCNRRDTLIHRLMAYNEGMAIWWWTKERLAQLLRMDQRHIPDDWCLRPQFLLWPPQRHKAIDNMDISTRCQLPNAAATPVTIDYIDFMRRAGWKSYQETSRMQRVGNCLSIL